ncbi:MAG TPA: hypothetical protein VLA31_05715 [Burkholderiaceae bacterium]|jgi:hypothetical protein|nr:hypothetical protein [Burkholderiaceae bacterium]
MATYSTGVTVSWGGTPFTEVTDLQWSYGGGMPKGRGTGDFRWTDEAGTLSVTCLGAANVSTAEWGLRRQLVVSGGGSSLTSWAVCESVGVAYEVNGVTRYTVTFKLLDN